jgi:hypothetical protein
MSTPSFIQVTSNARDVVRQLDKIKGAFQKVVAATLTDTAKAVTIRSERNLKRSMIIRAPYTTKSLKTYPASATKPFARQNAVSGTISPYLPIQDEGGKIRAKKKRIAVPTNRVRGKDRKKKVPGKYKLANMPKAFVLRPARPVKILKRAALFIREGKKGKLRKVRDIEARDYRLKATHWHTEASKKYGNYAYMARAFERNARRYLAGKLD